MVVLKPLTGRNCCINPLFSEHKTTEEEIRAFRDWSWMLIQYLNAIDAGFEKELQQLMDDPTNALDLTTASAETRNRSTQLYGMLGFSVSQQEFEYYT